MKKTVLITGASRGFGRLWTEALLERGDNVVATSRNITAFDDLAEAHPENLLPLALDITNKAQVEQALQTAKTHFGSVDVVINNAGYGVFGAIEELEEKQVRDLIDANIMGTLFVTQAAIPIMREQGKGHIIQLSSVLGIWALPIMGMYNATKFAVEGMSEANGYKTDFGGSSAVNAEINPVYEKVRETLFQTEGMPVEQYGTPEATVPAILTLIDAKEPPLRLFLGNLGLKKTKEEYAKKLAEWEAWDEVAVAAHG